MLKYEFASSKSMRLHPKDLAQSDYAYLAGIIDGEGTVTIHLQTEHKRGHIYYSFGPQVTISNTDRTMLISLQSRFGGNIVKVNPPKYKHWKQGYLLSFRREEILALLPRIIPYLLVKHRKAELLLEYMSTRNGGVRNGRGGRFIGIPLTKRQKDIIIEIRKKKRRGPSI